MLTSAAIEALQQDAIHNETQPTTRADVAQQPVASEPEMTAQPCEHRERIYSIEAQTTTCIACGQVSPANIREPEATYDMWDDDRIPDRVAMKVAQQRDEQARASRPMESTTIQEAVERLRGVNALVRANLTDEEFGALLTLLDFAENASQSPEVAPNFNATR